MAKLPITPRPIKYRAFNGKDMMTVQSLCFNHECIVWYGGSPHMGVSYTFDSPSWSEENPRPSEGDLKPVMQWTGLYDKNGVEVFEGDIISIEHTHFNKIEIGTVTYHEQFSSFIGMSTEGQYMPLFPSMLFEVVGNVYQNQDLLSS